MVKLSEKFDIDKLHRDFSDYLFRWCKKKTHGGINLGIIYDEEGVHFHFKQNDYTLKFFTEHGTPYLSAKIVFSETAKLEIGNLEEKIRNASVSGRKLNNSKYFVARKIDVNGKGESANIECRIKRVPVKYDTFFENTILYIVQPIMSV